MTTLRLASVVVLGLLLTGLAPVQTAHLAGRIVDAADARHPIRRAIVTITGTPLPAGRSAITDEQGRFSFAGIPAGEYRLSATRPGFLTATYGASRPGRPGTPISLSAGANLTDVTLVMSHGSAIGGVLRDVAGDPAAGMRVEAIRIMRGAGGDRGESGGVALTDDRGEFRIFGLPAGNYVVVATPTAIIMGIGEIGAPSDAEVDAIFATLPRRPAAPAATPPVPGTPSPVPATTPRKGYSSPPTYYPGVLQSGDAARITLGSNEERENVDFASRLSHAASIAGNVVPVRGQTVPPLQIMIRGGGPELPVFGGSAGGPSVTQRAADRTFNIANVPPGRYRIMARTFGGPGNEGRAMSSGGALPAIDASGGVQWAMADVDVSGDDLAGVTLALQPALRVTGRITFDAQSQRPPDAATARMALEAIADPEYGSNGVTTALVATVRRDGTFEFPSVIPGAYRLTASLDGWWARSATLSARDVLDSGLTIGLSDVGGLALTMSDRHTAIAGTLVGQGGRPATEYFVVAFPTDRAMWRAPSRRVLSTRPTTAGGFELKDLPPGAYFLAVLTDVEPADLEDAAFLESVIPAALTVAIGEGERKVQDMRIGLNGGSRVQGFKGSKVHRLAFAGQRSRFVNPEP